MYVVAQNISFAISWRLNYRLCGLYTHWWKAQARGGGGGQNDMETTDRE